MKLTFYKYQATGNDFIMIDGFSYNELELSQAQIRWLCDRHFGIGSDGLIILRPDERSNFFMDFYNPDGTHAGFCGNGGRCSVLFAKNLGIFTDKVFFRARDGFHQGFLENSGEIKLEMKDVCKMEDFGQEIFVNTGTEHVVVFVKNLDEMDIIPMARLIRYNERYKPQGVNVNFVQVLDFQRIKVRTYEKGVEHETLSCGTGVVASAIVSAYKFNVGTDVIVETKGGELKVSFEKMQDCFKKVFLLGSVNKVFSGEISI